MAAAKYRDMLDNYWVKREREQAVIQEPGLLRAATGCCLCLELEPLARCDERCRMV